MNTQTLKTQALPGLLSGTGRQPLNLRGELAGLAQADGSTAALKALSLAGQALRFARPQAPPSFAVETVVQDQRPIMADVMRKPLLRLLNGARPSDDAALALAWAFGRHKVRPHPFDLPRMDAFVRAHADHLGPAAQHWVQQRDNTSVSPRGYFDADTPDETTWIGATPARRARFIADRRQEDAAAARALIESVWTQESAETRLRLLMALETALGADDKSFLEGIIKDRAPRVRALAQRFLARISGDRGMHPALAACLERIRRTNTGLLKKRPALTLELPVTVKEHNTGAWIHETFAEVGCAELAGALELTETGMIDAGEKDANLSLAFALMATQDRRLDLLEQIIDGALSDAWEQMSECGGMDLGMMDADERLRWAGILIRPYAAKPLASYSAWSWLHRALERPVPEQLMEPVLRSSAWLRQLLDENKVVAQWMDLLAAMCPASKRASLRAMMAPLDPALTMDALALLDILDSLEKTGHHE